MLDRVMEWNGMEWNERGEREEKDGFESMDMMWVEWRGSISLHREGLRVAVMKIIIAAYGIDV